MATYNENVYDLTTAISLLQKRIEDNYKFLRSNFYGSSPPGPPSASKGELWARDDDNSLTVMGDSSAWHEIISLSDGKIALNDGQVDTQHISLSARVPTIVQGVPIDPSDCTKRTRPVAYSLPSRSDKDVPYALTPVPIEYSIYIPNDPLITHLYMAAEIRKTGFPPSYCIFKINGGTPSNSLTADSSTFTWKSEASLNIESYSGWVKLQISSNSGAAGELRGLSFRTNEL